MGRTKNKALAEELMDDLLENEPENAPPSSAAELDIIELDDSDGTQDLQKEPAPSNVDSVAIDAADSVDEPGSFSSFDSHSHPKEIDFGQDDDDMSRTLQAADGDDHTVKLSPSRVVSSADMDPSDATAHVASSSQRGDADDRVRASVGRFKAFGSGGGSSVTEAALAQSENLRIAQQRILDLENEVERLRVENEQLAAAGETFRRKSDELMARTEELEAQYESANSAAQQERSILQSSRDGLKREMDQLKTKNEELELRISTNIQKIRVRERELENRLELVKMEGAALIRSKDELILDLKRQIDQLNLELTNYRTKSQELNRQIFDKQDILRRTVKALRLALSMLEGEEEAGPQKKAK